MEKNSYIYVDDINREMECTIPNRDIVKHNFASGINHLLSAETYRGYKMLRGMYYDRKLQMDKIFMNILQFSSVKLLKEKRIEETISVLEEALKLHPGEIAFYNNYAISLFKGGKTQDAIKTIEAGLSLQPENRALLANYSKLKGSI